eukprot:scaffold20135_cov16-Prasinocladus_malaysianus.AAC.1
MRQTDGISAVSGQSADGLAARDEVEMSGSWEEAREAAALALAALMLAAGPSLAEELSAQGAAEAIAAAAAEPRWHYSVGGSGLDGFNWESKTVIVALCIHS